MAPKKPAPDSVSELKHNPFAGLAKHRELLDKAAPKPLGVVVRAKVSEPLRPLKVRIRLEAAGRSGKVVTRITGLPPENLEAIASRLAKALGCSANVQEADVVLSGALDVRAQQWLDKVGDVRMIADASRDKRPAATLPDSAVQSTVTSSPLTSSGTRRSDVRRGRRVAIVLKADQDTGKLTQGVVRDVLTNSAMHPRGIKVRLESGEVGRVQVIYE
jgi:uncharacterized repeat protein (TIGR03833 family)